MDSPGRLAGGSCAVSEEAERPVSSSRRCLQATQLVTSPSSPADPRQLHPTVFCRTTGQATPELDVSGEWKHPAVPGGCCPRLSTLPDPSLVAQIPAAGRTGPSHPGLPLPFTLPCLPPGPHSPPFRLSRLPGAARPLQACRPRGKSRPATSLRLRGQVRKPRAQNVHPGRARGLQPPGRAWLGPLDEGRRAQAALCTPVGVAGTGGTGWPLTLFYFTSAVQGARPQCEPRPLNDMLKPCSEQTHRRQIKSDLFPRSQELRGEACR